jgi:molybdenum cofactor biosynthesis protein B
VFAAFLKFGLKIAGVACRCRFSGLFAAWPARKMKGMLPNLETRGVRCAVLSIADTRTPESDESGRFIQARLLEAGHVVADYRIIHDEPAELRKHLARLAEKGDVQAVIANGGTGITPEDQTFDALEALLEKRLDGFGEIFRYLAYKELGPSAVLMRATAGVYQGLVIIGLPGAPQCVRLALEKLVLPELAPMAALVRKVRASPHRTGVH